MTSLATIKRGVGRDRNTRIDRGSGHQFGGLRLAFFGVFAAAHASLRSLDLAHEVGLLGRQVRSAFAEPLALGVSAFARPADRDTSRDQVNGSEASEDSRALAAVRPITHTDVDRCADEGSREREVDHGRAGICIAVRLVGASVIARQTIHHTDSAAAEQRCPKREAA